MAAAPRPTLPSSRSIPAMRGPPKSAEIAENEPAVRDDPFFAWA